MGVLETYEWSNIWWEHAPDTSKRRVLLVGDSISVGYRHIVNELLQGGLYADSYATSKALDNPFFLKELCSVMEQMPRVDLIHFNNGLHGFHLSGEAYAELYREAVDFLLAKVGRQRLILALSTPITKANSADTDDKNETVLERNRAVIGIAEKNGLAVNDLYTAVVGKRELVSGDGYHFNADGYRLLAEKCVTAIQKGIEII